MTTAALIPAAGQGHRLGLGPKALVELGARTLLRRVVDIVCPLSDEVWVACPDGFDAEFRAQAPGCNVITGGATRQKSIQALLQSCTADTVLIHDAARPLASVELGRRVLEAGRDCGYAASCLDPEVPVLHITESCEQTRVLTRHQALLLQSPQAGSRDLLERAYRHAGIEGLEFQSTLELVLSVGAKPGIVTGEKRNVKITTPADLEYAHFLIAQKRYDNE